MDFPKLFFQSFPFSAIACLLTIFGIIVTLGGIKMRRLRCYPLAITASIVAMLLFPIGLIFGIWSLVVLSRPEVRAAFEATKNDSLPKAS